jgi:hypothetical protein
LAVRFFPCGAAYATCRVPYFKIHGKWHNAPKKKTVAIFYFDNLKKWPGFYFFGRMALFAIYLGENYMANNAAAPHGKNRTQKPFPKTGETLIHIGYRPFWQGGKLFEGPKFGDKKIFSCGRPPGRHTAAENDRRALNPKVVNLDK